VSIQTMPASEARSVPEQSPATVAIQVTTLSKSFALRPVLRGLTFAVPAGVRVALLGPNGAGKTTLLRILATLAKPSAGEALVSGFDVCHDADQVRRRVGYVGHQPHLYEDLTARENLEFFGRMYGIANTHARADELLERFGLRAKANERVRALSRGQVQRLALARGILHEPALLLLDEPDTGLDEDALALLAEIVRARAAAGVTTLLTTHQIARGLALADSALVLAGGRLIHDGPADALDADDVRALYAAQRRAR
jgi:heme ABC exporter ATP-binding subunit CcmA